MTTILFGIHLLKNPSLNLLIVLIAVFLFHLTITVIITSRNRIQLSERMKVLGVLGIVGSIIIGFLPYFAIGVRNLLSIGMYGVTSLLSGGFYKEFNLGEVDEKKQERINKLTSSKREGETYQYTEYMTSPYLYPIFIILLIIITVTIIFIVKRRKALQLEFKGKKKKMSMIPSLQLKKDHKKERVVKQTAPSNIPIRKIAYKFEKEMKGIHSRKHGESFHDWLNRIHLLGMEFNSTLSEIYEKARYGEQNIPKNDVKFFNDGLKQIKKQLNNTKNR